MILAANAFGFAAGKAAHHGPSIWHALLPIIAMLLVVPVVVFSFFWWLSRGKKGAAGGSGKVVGVVGRMGSGKSYFAVRMAYKRISAGANVATNFSMNFESLCGIDGCDHAEAPCRAADLRSRWQRFTGWDQMAELANCVVIVDEAHLYAPSNKTIAFPDLARWKLSMARKFKLDLYWITQHENRVNSVLKDLTNMMYVCSSWFDAALFTAKGYEPEKVRRKNQHIDRRIYRLDLRIAGLYDTLELLEPDGDHVGKDGDIQLIIDQERILRGAGMAKVGTVKVKEHVAEKRLAARAAVAEARKAPDGPVLPPAARKKQNRSAGTLKKGAA